MLRRSSRTESNDGNGDQVEFQKENGFLESIFLLRSYEILDSRTIGVSNHRLVKLVVNSRF